MPSSGFAGATYAARMADLRPLVAAMVVLALTGCGGPGASRPEANGHPDDSPSGSIISSSPTRGHGPTALGPAARAAHELRRLDRAIDSRRTTETDLRQAGEDQQMVLRRLGLHPALRRGVLDRLPTPLRRRTEATIRAGHLLRSMHPAATKDLAHRLPPWRIQAPPPARMLLAAYHEAQRRYGVDWAHLAAINLVESAFGRVHGLSTAGARGPMQFIPATWRAYGAGGDVDDPHDAVLGAARLLAANGFARTPLLALRHYNDSAAYARAVTLLAGVIRREPRQFLAFYHWRVFYLTARGSVLLPIGYDERRGVAVRTWLSRHPEALVVPLRR
jgi:Transglycosylase SLT domain